MINKDNKRKTKAIVLQFWVLYVKFLLNKRNRYGYLFIDK